MGAEAPTEMIKRDFTALQKPAEESVKNIFEDDTDTKNKGVKSMAIKPVTPMAKPSVGLNI